jgi:Molecular chaperone GrpE (heat shock protein)
MEDKSIIAAANGFFINDKEEILLLRETGSQLWLTLAGIIKFGTNPKAALEAKAKKELNLKIENAQIFDSGFVDNILMIRFMVSEFSGEIKLGDKYEEFAWVKLSDIKDRNDVCPYVKKSFTKIADINELDNFENKYKLALADYQNLLKKTAADKTEFAKYAISDLLEDIIPVYDHLKMSLSGLPAEEENSAWVVGVKYVLKQFRDSLSARGVEEIKTVGEKFDHNTMEALEGEGDIVSKEIMSGYKLNGRLIRAAKVIVASK